MPLPFHSLNHGSIAFGFFQIEVDLLLLQEQFFFADEFCRAVIAVHAANTQPVSVPMAGYRISDPSKVGNVNGAIAGWDSSGIIGATYARFPFPADRAGFKQKTDGARHRGWARELLDEYGAPSTIEVSATAGTISIGHLEFSRRVYGELIDYVIRGGYPKWENETPPAYVTAMMGELGR